MTVHSTEISVPARISALPDLNAKLAELASHLGMAASGILRLQLVAEELFLNSVIHGAAQGDIALSLDNTGEGWRLRYRDSGVACDPFANPESIASDDEQPGGLGVKLIIGLCRHCRYERRGDENLIELLLLMAPDY